MNDHHTLGMAGSELGDLLRREALVHAAKAVPEDDSRFIRSPVAPISESTRACGLLPTPSSARCSDRGAGRGRRGLHRLLQPVQRPIQDAASVRRGAHDTAVAADEVLQRGAAVHVGHRHEEGIAFAGGCGRIFTFRGVRPSALFQHGGPIALHLAERGHVRH